MHTSIAHTDFADRDETATALRIVNSTPTFAPPLDIARRNAHRTLAEASSLDLDTATVGQVYSQCGALQESLRQVLAALDAEDGRHA
ncbi:hypothetical protein ABZT17_26760 [Streptomyces sp. NPDC005648]|uniref:hypothetical protein n=1 Tax=Streptomyces sp. NPDC005648 TaxID=3157044 RepID=UPI0033BE9A7D